MGVQVPCRVHVEVPQEVAVWANQAALGECIPRACQRKECRIEEGHLMPDHVHMLISIPPKYSVSEVIGYPKGKVPLQTPSSAGGYWLSADGVALLSCR